MIRVSVRYLFVVIVMLGVGGGAAPAAEGLPRKIVSLGPYLTEQLFLLGEGGRLVGCTSYCIHPEAARKILRVASSVEVNLEKVAVLRPDLVLATPLTPPRYVQTLKGLGIRVEMFAMPRTFEELCGSFVQLAELVGRKREAVAIVSEARREVGRLTSLVASRPRLKVFIQVGAKPLFTMSNETFVHDYIQLAGGNNIGADSGIGYFDYEMVLRRDPDVILIVSMGIRGEEEQNHWLEFPSISAVKNNRIYIVDSYKMCSPTPRSFAPMLRRLVELFHPGLE